MILWLIYYLFQMEKQAKKWTYLIMDLEMTGLNPFQHGVIEVGMMVLDDQFNIIWEFFMDLFPPPSCVIDQEALEYNGFTLDRIAKGRSYEEFVEFFNWFFNTYFSEENKPIMIGQYITADLSFLASIFNYTRKNSIYQKLWTDILDTKSMANRLNAIARYNGEEIPFKSTSLSKPGWISEYFGITGYDAHTARGDILATRAVLMKFLWVEEK